MTYYYVVRAVDTFDNESGNSNQASATPTDTIPPAAPTGLSASAGNQTVSLDWSNNGEADINGYNVYRSTTSGGTYTRLNGTLLGSSNYTDNSVTNGTTYYYVVTAVDTSSNESTNSGEVSAKPQIATDVNILGSWVSGTEPHQRNRLQPCFVFIAHAEHTAATSLTAVTYGGQSMTKVIDRIVSAAVQHLCIRCRIYPQRSRRRCCNQQHIYSHLERNTDALPDTPVYSLRMLTRQLLQELQVTGIRQQP